MRNEHNPTNAKTSTRSMDLELTVSYAGFGISEVELVYMALDEYVDSVLPFLVRHHSETIEQKSDDFRNQFMNLS